MRTLTKSTFRYAGVLLLISLLAASDRSAGQDSDDAQLISLNFPGGTAVAYVNAVRKAAGDINVVIDPEAGEVVMPSVTVKQVTVAAAIDLLDARVRETPGRRIQLAVAHLPVYDTRERQTYQVRARVGGRTAAQVASVWTVAALLDNDFSSKAVLSAVETALDVIPSPTKPDVRFHEDTALLIASGDEDQLQAIEKVLDRLDEAVSRRRDDEMRQFEMKLQEIDHDRQGERDKRREAEDELKNARQETIAMRQEMARLETMLAELQRMLETKERELTAAMADVRTLQLELQQERSRREPGRSNPGR
ncbi:MAG: hypothetical protein ACYS15_08985 [Planctomycetota bacterium]|jgi:hypothetical protein